MNDETKGILLTGATGFLGGEVLARLAERESQPIYALVRAPDDRAAQARLGAVTETLGLNGLAPGRRPVAVAGDIARPGLGLSPQRRRWLAGRTGRIIHCAASVSFTLGLEESRAINVEGTRRMLDLAELCVESAGLDSFLHVSTAYVAGTAEGRLGESELQLGQGFRNPYEQSKFEAEVLIRERSGRLPVQVVRPSIVVGDSRTGWTSSFNVLYAPLRAFIRGAYPAVPARRSSPVDVVPVDYVADAIVALAGRPGEVHHLTASGRASTVGEVIELASEHAGRPAPRVVSPALYRRAIHPVLVHSGPPSRRRALRRSEVFFPYFAMRTEFDDTKARGALAPLGIQPPPLRSYFGRLVEYAHAAHWGRGPQPRRLAAAGA